MNWLLLRGLSRDQRHWGGFVRALEGRSGGVVRGIDLPGTGTEHGRSSPASINAIVDDVRARALQVKNGAPGPWSLLGVSLGGMVAMQWSARHPGDFAGVVLVNTSAANLSAPWRRMDVRVVPSVLRALVERDPVARERRIIGITARMHQGVEATALTWATFQAERPIARATVLRQLVAASRFRAPAHIDIPVLVLSGARDPFTDPACPRRVAERFGARLEIHPQAGHDLTLDDPTWAADRITAWRT